MRLTTLFLSAMLFLLALPIGPASANPLEAVVSIPPQKYFVERIGRDRVQVSIMVQPGANPHTYEPKPSQMTALSRADIYFAIGVAFENAWLDRMKSANPKMEIARMDKGIERTPMQAGPHGKGEGRGKAMPDPHVWTSPPLVKIMAGNILDRLVALSPENAEFFKANHAEFAKELDQLDEKFTGLFKNNKGEKFMVFHPAWGYFAARYGLVQIPIEIQGKEPSPRQLAGLIDQARALGVKVIFVQPQISDKTAGLIARAIGGRVLKLNPLAEDWKANLEATAKAFEEALR